MRESPSTPLSLFSALPTSCLLGEVHPTMDRPGADARLELCDTDSLIKESKDSTASWSSQINAASCTLNSHLELVNFKNLCVPISESKIEN